MDLRLQGRGRKTELGGRTRRPGHAASCCSQGRCLLHLNVDRWLSQLDAGNPLNLFVNTPHQKQLSISYQSYIECTAVSGDLKRAGLSVELIGCDVPQTVHKLSGAQQASLSPLIPISRLASREFFSTNLAQALSNGSILFGFTTS